jgi:DNA helicase-2/ATP-dependent DNA helicase PcrA
VADGAPPRDHAVLVRANGHADPILRALNVAGIPWRFSGSSGLYARPEVRLLLAFLRTIADPHSSVDVYALAASEVYAIDGADLTSVVNMARRRHRRSGTCSTRSSVSRASCDSLRHRGKRSIAS